MQIMKDGSLREWLGNGAVVFAMAKCCVTVEPATGPCAPIGGGWVEWHPLKQTMRVLSLEDVKMEKQLERERAETLSGSPPELTNAEFNKFSHNVTGNVLEFWQWWPGKPKPAAIKGHQYKGSLGCWETEDLVYDNEQFVATFTPIHPERKRLQQVADALNLPGRMTYILCGDGPSWPRSLEELNTAFVYIDGVYYVKDREIPMPAEENPEKKYADAGFNSFCCKETGNYRDAWQWWPGKVMPPEMHDSRQWTFLEHGKPVGVYYSGTWGVLEPDGIHIIGDSEFREKYEPIHPDRKRLQKTADLLNASDLVARAVGADDGLVMIQGVYYVKDREAEPEHQWFKEGTMSELRMQLNAKGPGMQATEVEAVAENLTATEKIAKNKAELGQFDTMEELLVRRGEDGIKGYQQGFIAGMEAAARECDREQFSTIAVFIREAKARLWGDVWRKESKEPYPAARPTDSSVTYSDEVDGMAEVTEKVIEDARKAVSATCKCEEPEKPEPAEDTICADCEHDCWNIRGPGDDGEDRCGAGIVWTRHLVTGVRLYLTPIDDWPLCKDKNDGNCPGHRKKEN